MKPTSSSIIRVYVLLVVTLAHTMGCAPMDYDVTGGPGPASVSIGHDADLILIGQESGASTTALYRFSADGTKGKKIEPGPIGYYEMSANRARIVVYRGKPFVDEPTLHFVDPDGGHPTSLMVVDSLPQGEFTRISISPTGRYVAFGTEQSADLKGIYVAPTDGSAAKMLFPEGPNYFYFAWSPTEDKLAISEQYTSLYVYDAAGESLVEVMDSGSVVSGYGPFAIWSPDGQRLAFNEISSSTSVLVSVDKQGQDRRELWANMDRPMSNGSWSPDGRYFVLSEAVFYKDEYSDLLLIDANGTMYRSFLGEPYISALGWSPAGDLVYYPLDHEIKSATLAGKDAVLTSTAISLKATVGPNGRLAYSADGSPLKAIHADGSNPTTYSDVAKWVYYPDSWQLSHDGTVIVYAPNADANGDVPLYAAESDHAQTTLVLTAKQQKDPIWMSSIVDSSGILFQTENNVAGWVLPTKNGLQPIYPQIPLTSFDLQPHFDLPPYNDKRFNLSKAYAIKPSVF